MKATEQYKNGWTALFALAHKALKELLKNDPLRMAGATAFFTIFALPPILIIIVQVLSLLFNPTDIRQGLFRELSGTIGIESTREIVRTLIAVRQLADNWWITIGGFIFLLFVATTLFKIIRGSINQLWKIKRMVRQSFIKSLRARLKSIAVILLAGFLFVIGLAAEGLQTFLSEAVNELSPGLVAYFNSALSYLVSVVIVTVWFALLFRFLPDARPQWSVAFAGAFITSLLFNVGKFILRFLLLRSNLGTVYGTSSSIMLLLLFVFYSSLILYYGAAFTKVWAEWKGKNIKPLHGATHYHLTPEAE
jgi:membrane protein